ncbi:hypothetical protein SLS53_000405 [Cytospora paraplurivora]|uniref:Uncharacterized protein n=1 Tax=Cytospora paraplurivora TaxID=2898453 RepID=A0AAN9YPW6_9PEZI
MHDPETGREFWQNANNESLRWTDPLNPHRWWSRWTDGDGDPFWLDDFTQETLTEEPLNANWSITLRSSDDCLDEDEHVIGLINHPIANGCYSLDAGGEIDLGSGTDSRSFRYTGSFTVYPGPCKIKIFKFADCPSSDAAWLTSHPTRWDNAKWAVIKPEAGPQCFRVNEGRYVFNNASGTNSVSEDDKAKYCTGDPLVDDPDLPQHDSWPEDLGDELKEEMSGRWSAWLDRQFEKMGVEEDSGFGKWLAREVRCRTNVESANIQEGLARDFAPSIQVMCPAGDVSQWWRGDDEP